MPNVTYVPDDAHAPESQIGATMDALAKTIHARRGAGSESYTHELLEGDLDTCLKKLTEEAVEVALAAKDADEANYFAGEANDVAPDTSAQKALNKAAEQTTDHLRYEAADVIYHLLVICERFSIGIDELAAELNMRMTDKERPEGAVMLYEEHVQRGK
ncbi:MAG: phosphoribosyl-ATP diphosphatase [Eggerthellaceae bacterium]|nr:phosphoribosyl-ATP diphosphatase [Eggerthellaceae bacterium]